MDSNEGEKNQKKIYLVNEQLRELHSRLQSEIQRRIPLENLTLLANILVTDENILEIVKGLRECQNATEKILRQQRDEQIFANQREIEEYTRALSESELAHTVPLVKIQHEKKLKEVELSILQQLDNAVKEQQQTLFALSIPGFYETVDPKEIITQMHLINFILKIQKNLESQL